MRTYLDCIPCFLRQALDAVRIVETDKKLQKEVLDEVSKLIPQFPLNTTPPEMGVKIHRVIKKLTGKRDPYKKIKEKSQKIALGMYKELKEYVMNAEDRLAKAIQISCIGNVIDFAINDEKSIKKDLENIHNQKFAVFEYEKFKNLLKSSQNILYLADNAGETVFDRILIEEISQDKNIYYAVRGAPTINDALEEDAKEAGIDKYAAIISNGSDVPGTLLNQCSEEFKEIFRRADMIISKGQGNFESLYGNRYPIFYLFKAKCLPVSKELSCQIGDLILKKERD